MKAVVTGGAGFIGSTLVDRLLGEGNEVIAVDNFDDHYSGKRRFLLSHVGKDGFRLDEVDVLDLNSLRRSVEGADVVFHLAAQAGAGISARNPTKAHMANTTGMLNVLLAAKNAGVRRVISSSSSSVYGNARSLPVKETDPAVPISPYAASMLAGEEYCRLFYDLYELQSVSLRYFTVYGPRQPPGTAIMVFAERVLSGQRPQIYGDGNQTGDFTFVSDVVDAIRRSADCPDPKGRPLNICSGLPITENQVVMRILGAAGRPDLEPEHLPAQEGDVEQLWGDNTMAKEILDWEPKFPLEKGLIELVEWYKKFRDRIN
ncbi:MAG: NAD-dependent epimerase/dehydratase family protein [Methanomassiliicoccales archaeon]|jgi:UDP-glucose 4-epimerase